MPTVNFNTATRLSAATAVAVSFRATWAASWTSAPEVTAEQCAWTIAPEVATATLRRPYGRVLLPGASSLVNLSRVDIRGYFIKIDWATDEAGVSTWLGYVESQIDEPIGLTDGVIPASGTQLFVCYGLEKSLLAAPVLDAVWKDNAPAASASAVVRGGSAIAFNANGRPNRSAAAISGIYVYEPDPETAEFWTSRQIIQYLLANHLPTNTFGVATLPWLLTNETIVPDWDAPVLETDGQTVYGLITELLAPRSLLGWTVSWNATNLLINPFSLTASTITLETTTFPANSSTVDILAAADPLTRVAISEDANDTVDQVIVRGARRVSVATVSYVDANLVEGWDPVDDLNDYNAGASAGAGYAALDQYDKRKLDSQSRGTPPVQAVFREFEIPLDWDAMAENALEDPPESVIVFPIDGSPATIHRPFPGRIRILQALPLDPATDYSDDEVDIADTGRVPRRPPLITLVDPDTTERREVGNIAQAHFACEIFGGGEPGWTIQPRLADDRRIAMDITGAPQHLIAGSDFVPLAVDPEPDSGYDYRDLKATLAIEEDRHAEARWPATLGTTDVVRRRIVYAGDGYQCVYLVPGTVYGLDAEGVEKLAVGGYICDDRPQLLNLARLLAGYHTVPRKSMTLQTHRRTGAITVGSMLTTIDGYPTAVNALISRIEMTNPETDGAGTTPATQTITAATVPVDPMSVLALTRSRRRF